MIEIALGALLAIAKPPVEGAAPEVKVGVPAVRFEKLVWGDESRTWLLAIPASEADLPPAAALENYDNWRLPEWNPPGQTLPVGVIRIGDHVVSDDLDLADYSPRFLTSMGSGYAHIGPPGSGNLSGYRLTIRWYLRGEEMPLFTFTAPALVANPTQPGQMKFIYFADGFWNSYRLVMPRELDLSFQFTETIGTSNDNIGIVIGGPRNTGYSSSRLRNRTTGETLDLGSDQVNAFYYIRTSPPGPLVLLAPEIGQRHISTAPTLAWVAAGGTTVPTYTVRIADNPALENPIHISPPHWPTEYTVPPGVLEPCRAYYWGVTAVTSGGNAASNPVSSRFFTLVPADFNRDGQVDFFDYLDFVQAFSDDDPAADFNADGQVDFFDYLDFIERFAQGC